MSKEALYTELKSLLRNPVLLWTSESDYPVEVAMVGRSELTGWQQEGDAHKLLYVQSCNKTGNLDQHMGWGKLYYSLKYCDKVAYRRPTGKPAEFEILIGVWLGDSLVGIRTKVIET